jgi:hypothetical protein
MISQFDTVLSSFLWYVQLDQCASWCEIPRGRRPDFRAHFIQTERHVFAKPDRAGLERPAHFNLPYNMVRQEHTRSLRASHQKILFDIYCETFSGRTDKPCRFPSPQKFQCIDERENNRNR